MKEKMIRATVNFLNNCLAMDLPLSAADLQDYLNSIGILMSPNQIGLNNNRTVRVGLRARDKTGEKLLPLISPVDTLAKLNKVCNAIYCLDYRLKIEIIEGLDCCKLKSLDDLLNRIDKLKERRYSR